MLITIVLIVILILILLLLLFNRTNKNHSKVEKIKIDDIDEPDASARKLIPQILNPNFIEAQFHQDYMDVITSFNNIAPNQRQIFNINNVPCKVTKNADKNIVGEIVRNFINELNADISKNVPLVHTANSGWDELLPEHCGESGWEKQMKSLGLPTSLYNKPKLRTHVKLANFSNITKYETENEVKYTCCVTIAKKHVNDDLVIKISFVLPKNGTTKNNDNGYAVILEEIFVLGFSTRQGLGTDRSPLDDYYYFDSLEKNNMLSGKQISRELMNKYDTRQKVMQERINGMEVDVQEKYDETPSPIEYDSYKLTNTIFDDMNNNENNDRHFS